MAFRAWWADVVAEKMKAGNDPGPFAGAFLYFLAGPLIWAGHLFLVYAPQSALCAFRVTRFAAVDPLLIRILVGAVTAIAATALVLALCLPEKSARLLRADGFLEGENGPFMIRVMRLLAALSLAGVLWAGAAALLADPCAQFR